MVLSLQPGVTAFVGRNGQGKTNLVESLVYLSTFASPRVAADAALVRRNLDGGPQPGGAVVRAKVCTAARAEVLELEIVAGRANRARLNRGAVRPRELLGHLRTVLFAPEDLALVRGEPAGRRDFLDRLLVQGAPRLVGLKADLDKVLRQRGALLKQLQGQRGAAEAQLAVWDEPLIELGSELTAARARLVADLLPGAQTAYRDVSGTTDDFSLTLRLAADPQYPTNPAPSAAALAELLRLTITARRADELRRGVNLVGPQRDELELTLGGLPAKGYASHGESWSCALALRLASFELLRQLDDAGDPVLILDDVFAELDASRRDRLAELVAGVEQVLITAAVAADVPPALGGHRVWVEAGQLTSASGAPAPQEEVA